MRTPTNTNTNTVRAESTRAFRFTKVEPKVTKLELVFRYVPKNNPITKHFPFLIPPPIPPPPPIVVST